MDKQPDVKKLTEEVVATAEFKQMMNYLFEEKEEQKSVLTNLETVAEIIDFQEHFSRLAVRGVLDKTSDGLTYSGAENLHPSSASVFIANHRDIVLDSAMMQYLLFAEKVNTSYVVIGDNLMFTPFVQQLCLLNKIFAIPRGGAKLEKYKNAIKNSLKIRSILTEKKESVWIAQRNGRTKDGDDRTQSGVLKMLNGTRKDYLNSFKELNIIPVTVSYEFEPCDAQKVSEMYYTKEGEYVKAPDEDYKSVMSGLVDYKGRIHMHFGRPVNDMLADLTDSLDPAEIYEVVQKHIDTQMHRNYKLWPPSYIAYSILSGSDKYAGEFTESEQLKFEEHLLSRHIDKNIPFDDFRQMMLQMYAKPVYNFESL